MIMLNRNCFRVVLCAALLQLFAAPTEPAADAANTQTTPAKKAAAIPWDQVGAKAGADYHGEGLSVAATGAGARLHCVFQRLEGEATAEGLWLVSTVTNQSADRFRVVAREVGRQGAARTANIQHPTSNIQLSQAGKVSVAGQSARFTRAGLVEEYSVSMDGVRQDFVVTEKPAGEGPLKVQLAVSGARVEPAAYGAQLVLEKSGRKIAYSRVRATDATGKELPARLKVQKPSAFSLQPSAFALSVVVNDADAVYPVRIDPTFSDANWISLGGTIPGTDKDVYAAAVDGSGNLYIGGFFTAVGDILVNHVAKWNGTSWSALGSGMIGELYGLAGVHALAVSGSTLYAGGWFMTAGDANANYIAQWDGTNWSPLGSGMDGTVHALAVSHGTLYAGGEFTTAGETTANYIAQWDGTNWSPLGSGMGPPDYSPAVYALAVSGTNLYAGGYFTNAGGNAVNSMAQWNGSSWSALGSGVGGGGSYERVYALAVSGSTLYAGGADFTTAGGNAAGNIAQWNGTNWSELASGMNSHVSAVAVLGTTLYAGGSFIAAGDAPNVNYIAQWDGSSWSALGSGMGGVDPSVNALAVSGSTLYVGGHFTTAGGTAANGIAQ
jgi:hypothetical protein